MDKKPIAVAVARALAGPTLVQSPMIAIRLFKYLKRQFADDLLTTGSIRVGTLYDFRRAELARGVSDPSEGTKQVQYSAQNLVIDGEKFYQFSGRKVRSVNVSGPRVTFQRDIESPNFFLLCLSSERRQAVMAQFDNVDTCLEISDFHTFFREITATLNATVPVSFVGIRECQYTERVEQWNEADLGTHPALLKEPHFATQKEVRAIWRPSSPAPIQPIIIRSPKLIGFCADVTKDLY